MRPSKTLKRILDGSTSIRFADITALVESYGFHLSRVNGSHHIFAHPDVPELINLQKVKGRAKPYQIRQVLALIERYNLQAGDQS